MVFSMLELLFFNDMLTQLSFGKILFQIRHYLDMMQASTINILRTIQFNFILFDIDRTSDRCILTDEEVKNDQ
jgi:hypothetical protein